MSLFVEFSQFKQASVLIKIIRQRTITFKGRAYCLQTASNRSAGGPGLWAGDCENFTVHNPNSALASEKIRQGPAGPGCWRASNPRVGDRAFRSCDPEARVLCVRQDDVAAV